MHFGIKSVAEVVAERRNVVQEKYTGRGASSRGSVQKIGEMTFFCGRCKTGVRNCLIVRGIFLTSPGCQMPPCILDTPTFASDGDDRV